jgi:hypothetical protein
MTDYRHVDAGALDAALTAARLPGWSAEGDDDELAKPSPRATVLAALRGPADLAGADVLLSSRAARAWLTARWSTECPTPTLLARSVPSDTSAHAADRDPAVALAAVTRRLLDFCHAFSCQRCKLVLDQLASNPALRHWLASLHPDDWTDVIAAPDTDPTAHWDVRIGHASVEVTASGELDGTLLVVVDTAVVTPLRLVELRPTGSRSGAHISSSAPEHVALLAHEDLTAFRGGAEVPGSVPIWLSVDLLLRESADQPIRGTGDSVPPSVRLEAVDPATGVTVFVTSHAARWRVRLVRLTSGRSYRIELRWPHETTPETLVFNADSAEKTLFVSTPASATGAPSEVRLFHADR